MKTRMFIFLLIPALMLLFAACGEETSSAASKNHQMSGTVLDKSSIRVANRDVRAPMLKKTVLPPVNIQTWPMISTGQTKCYDYKQEIECPKPGESYSGQDGQTRYGTRSLKLESNNEIVRDDVTKLLWTKQIKQDVTWYEAKSYCDSLRLNNKTWRLPTTAELRSIVNYGKVGPAIDDVFYKQGLVVDEDLKDSLSNWFWASKHIHFNSETEIVSGDSTKKPLASSWIINFYDGFVEYTSRYNIYNVRCVTAEF